VTDDVEREWESHVQWFADHLKIRDKQARVVPFELNNVQLALERYKWECMKAGIPCYIIVLKARQEGCSTWAQGTFFHDSRDHTHRRHIVVAHTDEASRNLFSMARMFVDQYDTDQHGSLETEKSSAKSLKFKDTGSEYTVQTAGSGESGGRSFTFNGAHLSECDFWSDPEDFYGAMMQTIPDVGGTVVIIESTANGPMLFMNQMWDQAVEGRSEFKPFFFPWFVHHEYTRPLDWDDLLKYATREWIAKNRRWVESSRRYEEEKDGLGSGSGESPDGGGHRSGREEVARAGDRPSGGAAEDPGRHRGETGEGERGGSGREDEGAGDRAGRPDPGSAGGRSDRGGNGGPSPDPRDAELSSDGGVGEGGQNGDGRSGEASPDGRVAKRQEISNLGIVRANSIDRQKFGLKSVFKDSLMPYEIGLIEEFGVTLEQINWLRWCLENRCKGDETRRRREYPSRPEEAFEASGADVLDPRVLAVWSREAKENPPIVKGDMIGREIQPGMNKSLMVSFDETHTGKISVWEFPDPKKKYVHFIDPSLGIEGSDWQVGFVMDAESGEQVAEFRATIDPDLAKHQLEYLSVWYNRAFTTVETTGGYGWPFLRHLIDVGTIPMYERMAFDRQTKAYTKKPGWDTNAKTRPLMISELKEAVRKERIKVRSLETINELRTLHENDYGKIEARPGYHDDGAMACAGAVMLRSHLLGEATEKKEAELKLNNVVLRLDKRLKRIKDAEKGGLKKMAAHSSLKTSAVRAQTVRVDGKRSYI